MLNDHKLKSIEAFSTRDTFPRYVGRNAFGNPQRYGAGIGGLRLTTDRGAQGWGTGGRLEDLKPLLGLPLSDLFDPNIGILDDRARGLDIGLHDLAGRILGKPVHGLLGSNGPTSIPVYSGAIYFDDMEPPEGDPDGVPRGVKAIVDSCRQDYETGYRAFKLKIGRGHRWMEPEEGLAADIDAVRAVRESFPDYRILVDANDAYEVDTFIRFLDGVADCDLHWIEEPFEESETDLRKLKEHMQKIGCSAFIAEGEGRNAHADPPTPYGGYVDDHINRLYNLARKDLVDVFIIDLGIVGFTRWRHIMADLAAENILASPHTWAWCVRPFYTAHLGRGVGNIVTIEGIPGVNSVFDFSEYTIHEGNIVVPDAPGFGFRIQESEIEVSERISV